MKSLAAPHILCHGVGRSVTQFRYLCLFCFLVVVCYQFQFLQSLKRMQLLIYTFILQINKSRDIMEYNKLLYHLIRTLKKHFILLNPIKYRTPNNILNQSTENTDDKSLKIMFFEYQLQVTLFTVRKSWDGDIYNRSATCRPAAI